MNNKLIGGILLITGTAIGSGMLALPIATSEIGFLNSFFCLIALWAITLIAALLLLEVNLWLAPNTNIISMSKATLGKYGQTYVWIFYLLLHYALLSAYIAGGGGFVKSLLAEWGWNIPRWLASLSFTILIAMIVYQGIKFLDYSNRALMIAKFGAFILLVICLSPFVSSTQLTTGDLIFLPTSLSVIVTSFGFANIIPSLRTYFKEDTIALRKAICWGSILVLFCYLAWELVIMGLLPHSGKNGLVALLHSTNQTGGLIDSLSGYTHSSLLQTLTKLFTGVCLATSFLGVSLSLTNFLSDGLGLKEEGFTKLFIYLLAFIPPILIIFFYPGAFIHALAYAGIICGFLLILIPALMVWSGRYVKRIAFGYQVGGGKCMLVFIILCSVVIIANGFAYDILKII